MSSVNLELVCLLWPNDDPNEHIIIVKIADNRTVYSLKELIKDKYDPKLRHLGARDLVLWKCSIPAGDNLQKTLNSVRFDATDTRLHRLRPISKISEHFTTDLPCETIHILVEVPGVLEKQAPPLPPSLPKLLKERRQYNANLLPIPLSTLGDPTKFSKIQETDTQKIIWSRPPAADATIPVTLYHPIFRQFIDDCKNHQPIDEDNKLVRDLTEEMSNFFPNDDARTAELRGTLRSNEIRVASMERFLSMEGAINSNNGLPVIIKVKEEIGSKGADPYAEAILYYANSNWQNSEEHLTFNFPCLIITVFGPQISFSGAVWTTRPQFQVLTPTLPLFCHLHDTDMRDSLARHFGALKKAISSLEKYYNSDALTNPALMYNLNPQFPDPHTFLSLETKTHVNFTYLRQIDKTRLLFIGETDNRERICIKFVRQYSQAAHEKCAEMGIAPSLKGFEDIGAGWKIVIMEALDEQYNPYDSNNLPEGAAKLLREQLLELHQANFVHGDICDYNIMVSRKDGIPRLMLIDFDWSGVIGEVRYPSNVNKTDFWRPDDVSDGLLIKPEHDIAMFDRIFRRYITFSGTMLV